MGPGIPVVPDGCQFPGSCLVSCSQSSRLQMCGELVSTWGLSQMLNNAVDHGYMQHASSCMYKGLNVLYLCLFYHSNLSLECFFHNRSSNMYCAAGYWCMKHKNKTKKSFIVGCAIWILLYMIPAFRNSFFISLKSLTTMIWVMQNSLPDEDLSHNTFIFFHQYKWCEVFVFCFYNASQGCHHALI